MTRQERVLFGPHGLPFPVQLEVDPWVLFGPAVAVALIFATVALAIAIGSGVVGWSYWWLLPSGIPATLAVVMWLFTIFSGD